MVIGYSSALFFVFFFFKFNALVRYGEYFESRGQPLKYLIKYPLITVFQDDGSVFTVDKHLLATLALGAHSSSAAQSPD